MSPEAERIIHNCAAMRYFNGVASKDVVNEVLNYTGGQIFCRGTLLEIEFTPITSDMFRFYTVDWYAKHYGGVA